MILKNNPVFPDDIPVKILLAFSPGRGQKTTTKRIFIVLLVLKRGGWVQSSITPEFLPGSKSRTAML
jgi:hypothetical protein